VELQQARAGGRLGLAADPAEMREAKAGGVFKAIAQQTVEADMRGPDERQSHGQSLADQQAANADRMAVMQVTQKVQPVPYATETPRALAVPRPSGSIRGPARELGRFYETLLRRGRGILSPQAVEAMTARHRTYTLDKTFGAVIDWGLGFMINSSIYGDAQTPYQFGPHASPRTFGHSGNQSSVAFADPDNALVAVVIFNGMPGEVPHQTRMRAVLTALYEDLGLASAALP